MEWLVIRRYSEGKLDLYCLTIDNKLELVPGKIIFCDATTNIMSWLTKTENIKKYKTEIAAGNKVARLNKKYDTTGYSCIKEDQLEGLL
ncbi:MAG: hypothetical protein GY821_12800 [Gammaproteobacteria bacterium]|nr:hypothetical protein [Gammaproteobacteria bacterium]